MPGTNQNRFRDTDMPGDNDVILLQRDVADHKEKLDKHIAAFDEHVEAEHDRWDHLLTVTENNAKSITELTAATKSIVEWSQTGESLVKAGSTLGKFCKWLASIGIIGVAIMWAIEKLG